MALSELESGYIGSPEKWRNFFEKMANCNEIRNAYLEDIKFEQERGYPISTHLSIEAFDCRFNITKMVESNYSDSVPKSFSDFIAADGFGLYDFLNFRFCSIIDLITVRNIKSSSVTNKYFFKDLVFEDIPDDLYYSYNDWKGDLVKYNGAYNAKFMAQNYNMMLGELGFGFPKSKTKIYSNALVIGLDGNYASVLLLPDEKTKDGEMEAWLFDAEDIYRFRSFAEMIIWNWLMRYDYRGSELTAFLKRVGVDEILDLDVLASNAYVSRP